MANFRPAGFSDEDSDSDEYSFFDKPERNYTHNIVNERKRIEINLQDAILNGNIQEVEEIVASDLNYLVNLTLDSGWTPLMHACFHAQDKIVKYLLDKGADPNAHSDSVTPIMTACSNSSASNEAIYNIVLNLIDKGCTVNIGDKYGQTPLMRAISSGRTDVVVKLIDLKVNIEMRDQQGWTAVFWAAHHNQPDILEILIGNGARLAEVDRNNRSALDIAKSHNYEKIMEILKQNIGDEEDEKSDDTYNLEMTPWQDYYPGINKMGRPNYTGEIPHLLYGMNCERLTSIIMNSGLDLRSFLLLDDSIMIKIGIEMPYERQRLKVGLRNFHKRGWKLDAIAGLYVRKADNHSMLDYLTSLGTHLQQIYILEATMQYTLREYCNIQNQLKHEPPDSILGTKLNSAAKKLLANIHNVRNDCKNMKIVFKKIIESNPEPADLIQEKSLHDLGMGYIMEVLVVLSIGLIGYHAKTFVISFFKK